MKGISYCEYGGLVIIKKYHRFIFKKDIDIFDGLFEKSYQHARSQSLQHILVVVEVAQIRSYLSDKYTKKLLWKYYDQVSAKLIEPHKADLRKEAKSMGLFIIDLTDNATRNELDNRFGFKESGAIGREPI